MSCNEDEAMRKKAHEVAHSLLSVEEATARLKEAGFKIVNVAESRWHRGLEVFVSGPHSVVWIR